MRRVGAFLIALGLILLTAAGTTSAENQTEASRAGAASSRVLHSLEAGTAASDDLGCLGCLTIPRLELELPVLSEWSYENLKTAPCRYSGSIVDGDLVLIAHNYRTHFGPIRRLKPGDRVSFEDMDGTVFEYLVTASEIVLPTALVEVTAGEHDLTLITCTYGGKTRVVVYCDAAEA